MSTMTLEQVRDRLMVAAHDENGGPQIWSGECHDLADAIDAHLREREAAKAGVTDEMAEIAYGIIAENLDGFGGPLLEGARAALEAVAPMLASERVPDASWFEKTLCEARNKWAEQCEVNWLETDDNHPDEWMGKYIRDALLAAEPNQDKA